MGTHYLHGIGAWETSAVMIARSAESQVSTVPKASASVLIQLGTLATEFVANVEMIRRKVCEGLHILTCWLIQPSSAPHLGVCVVVGPRLS